LGAHDLRGEEPLDASLLRWLHSVLQPPVTQCDDWTWPAGKAAVREVRDGSGTTWFVKQHRGDEWYRPERDAYLRWAPSLGDRAPRLVANNDEHRFLLLSALRRDGTDWRNDAVRRDAGAVLRRLHDAEAFGSYGDLAGDKPAELEVWARRGAGLLNRHELDVAFSAVRALEGLPAPERVPCHRDYTPRNWVLHNGLVYVVDFEEARLDAWMTDFGRLAVGWWRTEPHMMDAIFDGYGRNLTADETALMRSDFAVTATRLIVLGSELGAPERVADTRAALEYVRSVL
jgi:Ser/Thr protein kinase RdoA (MazF antagonist)